uniref:Transposase Tc1-like domain-containing protein n=1 Tax=Mola mola TaxID=94237 RepID=A0A3Q3WLE4_MOLML
MHFSLKLIGQGKTYKEVQKMIGCSAKMISNALKWRAKPETRGRKRKTTIKMDRRITRMAKAQPMISSRMIKDSLELPVSTVTVRRRLCEANLFTRIPRETWWLHTFHVCFIHLPSVCSRPLILGAPSALASPCLPPD